MGTMGESYLECHPCWHYRQDWERMESPGISGAGTFKKIRQLEGGKGLVLNHGDRARKGEGRPRCPGGSRLVMWLSGHLVSVLWQPLYRERGKGGSGTWRILCISQPTSDLKPSPSPSPDLLH